jgi:signal transduction histidine kinase
MSGPFPAGDSLPIHKRLSARIAFWLALTVGVALLAHLVVVASARRVENTRAQDGRRLAHLFQTMASYELSREGHDRLQEHFAVFHPDTLLRDLRLVGRSGRTMAAIEPAVVGAVYIPGQMVRDLGSEMTAGIRVDLAVRQRRGEEPRLVARAPIANGPACASCHAGAGTEQLGVVAVELSLAEVDRTVARARTRLLLLGFAVTLLAMGGIVFMVRRLLGAPLDRLLHVMARVESGHLDARVAPVGSDELGLVASRFNRMADELERMSRLQEQTIHERTARLADAEVHAMQQEKLAALGVLSAGVAHEIGNPLAAISAVTEMLHRLDTDPEHRRHLDLILTHISRISSILRRLGELARTPPDQQQAVDVNEILDTTLALVRFDPRAKTVAVECDLAPALPRVLGTGPRLLEVFLNICLNALDAMPEGGRLQVRSRSVPGAVAIEFADTGTGMSEEVRLRIFETFFTTKPVGAGTGLGLAVSHRVIEDHGGAIAVESTPGHGTVFTVRLPAAGSRPAEEIVP